LEACRVENDDRIFVEQFQPDFTAYVQCLDKKVDLFITEIKKPKSENPGPYTDLNKLAKELKMMLHSLIMAGVLAPKVCGLIVSG
jgi:hypothetical protein